MNLILPTPLITKDYSSIGGEGAPSPGHIGGEGAPSPSHVGGEGAPSPSYVGGEGAPSPSYGQRRFPPAILPNRQQPLTKIAQPSTFFDIFLQ